MYYKGGRGVVPPWDCQCHAGVVRYETDYGILLMSVCQNSPGGEVVRKVKHSSVRIENPLLALYRGLGFSPEMSANLAQVRGEPCVQRFRTFAFRRDGATSIFVTTCFVGSCKIACGLVAKKSSEIHA